MDGPTGVCVANNLKAGATKSFGGGWFIRNAVVAAAAYSM